MRKTVRTVLWIIFFWMTTVLRICAAQCQLPEEIGELYARSAVVIDGSSGRVLFGKNADETMPMASTTKIMTCILALENGDPEDIVEVSQNAAGQPEVHLGAGVGETFYLKDLLYALMLESYNDAAVMIAEQVSGSVEEFAGLMNQKAKELGCNETHFVTPNGLDSTDDDGVHQTTAQDLARIMKYCVWDSPKAAEFREITQTRSLSFSNREGTRSYACGNHNAFLDMYEGVVSGKTGFTSAAGYCYVCAVESEGRKFAGVVLACGWPYNRTYKWKDMTKMMDYAKKHYREVRLDYPEEIMYAEVKNGWIDGENPWKNIQIPLCIEKSAGKIILIGDQEKLIRHLEYRNTIEAPVERNMVLGKIQFTLNGVLMAEKRILSETAVAKRKPGNWLVWTLQMFHL